MGDCDCISWWLVRISKLGYCISGMGIISLVTLRLGHGNPTQANCASLPRRLRAPLRTTLNIAKCRETTGLVEVGACGPDDRYERERIKATTKALDLGCLWRKLLCLRAMERK